MSNFDFFGLLEYFMATGDPNLDLFDDNTALCARHFDRVVFPRLQAAFPDQELPHVKGSTCTKIRFGQRKVWEGTEYDGISIAIPKTRSRDFIPRVIEGILTLNGELQHESMFGRESVEEMIEEIRKLKG